MESERVKNNSFSEEQMSATRSLLLGRELREGSSPFLKRRRFIIGFAFSSCAALAYVTLYQVGILKKLPSPRHPWLNAERVNGSAEAYSHLSTPDAALGFVSYGITACLAAAGSESRWRSAPYLPIGLGIKVLADATVAGKLTIDEWRKFRSFSLYSLGAAVTAFGTLALAVPEARAALQKVATRKA